MSDMSNSSDPAKDLVPRSSPQSRPAGGLGPEPARQLPATLVRGYPARAPEPQQGVTVQFILHACRQWWKVATPIGLLLAVAAAAGVYMIFEPVYEAVSVFQIRQEVPFLAFQTRDDSRGAERFVQTQIELIRDPLVLSPVVEQPEIAGMPELEKEEDQVQWLQEQIQVSQVGQSELYRISFACSDAENSALVVNAVVREYFKLLSEHDDGRTQKVIELLNQVKSDREEEVRRLQDDVRALAKETTGQDPSAANLAPNPNLTYPLADLQSRLTTVEIEIVVLEARIKAYEESARKESEELGKSESVATLSRTVRNTVAQHPEVQRLNEQIAAKRAKLHEIETKSAQGDKDPLYQQVSDGIRQDEQTFEQLRKDLREQITEEMKGEVVGRREEDLARMQSELKDLQTLQTALQDKLKAMLEGAKESSGDTVNLQFKQSELARAEEVLDLISARVEKLRTEQQAPARITLLRPAKPPDAPVELLPYRNMALASLIGFCLPFVLAVSWEHLVRRINTARQIEENSGLAVVGEITRLPTGISAARSPSSERVGRGLMIFEESIDGLRTSLMLSESLKDMKVLAVTSAAPGEGKTSVASQLAVSIARALGEPVLLIDGDLRSPDIHKVFEVPLEPGLAGVLGGECAAENAIVTTWSKWVHLLPAGKLHMSPHKLLGNGALKSLLDEVRPSYRYVIIDTPPVLAASEALVLANAAEMTLMCTMRDISRMDQVKKAHERLVAAGSPPIGTVLNGVPAREYSHRYGSYAYARR